MSEEQSLELVIKTKADLAGAREAEAQLERDIAKAKALGDSYHECEARLKSVRAAIADHQATTGPDDGQPGEISTRANTGLASGLLGWIMLGIEAAQRATRAAFPTPQSDKKAAPSADENQGGGLNSGAAPAPTVDPANREGVQAPVPGDTEPAATVRPENQGGLETPTSRDTQPAPTVPSENDSPQSLGEREPESSAQIARAATDRTQSLQAAEEQMRAALEQNTQITISLLNRMLGLIDAQNRKLSEVDLKTSELSSQIKSLKNP